VAFALPLAGAAALGVTVIGAGKPATGWASLRTCLERHPLLTVASTSGGSRYIVFSRIRGSVADIERRTSAAEARRNAAVTTHAYAVGPAVYRLTAGADALSTRAVNACVAGAYPATPFARSLARGGGTRTYITCSSNASPRVSARPRECFVDFPSLALSGAIDLHNIHWQTWGGRSASARALIRDGGAWRRVDARAFARQRCGPGLYSYTEIRVGLPSGAHTWSLEGCVGP